MKAGGLAPSLSHVTTVGVCGKPAARLAAQTPMQAVGLHAERESRPACTVGRQAGYYSLRRGAQFPQPFSQIATVIAAPPYGRTSLRPTPPIRDIIVPRVRRATGRRIKRFGLGKLHPARRAGTHGLLRARRALTMTAVMGQKDSFYTVYEAVQPSKFFSPFLKKNHNAACVLHYRKKSCNLKSI